MDLRLSPLIKVINKYLLLIYEEAMIYIVKIKKANDLEDKLVPKIMLYQLNKY